MGEKSEVSCFLFLPQSLLKGSWLYNVCIGLLSVLLPGIRQLQPWKSGRFCFEKVTFVFQERGTSNSVKTMPSKAESVRTLPHSPSQDRSLRIGYWCLQEHLNNSNPDYTPALSQRVLLTASSRLPAAAGSFYIFNKWGRVSSTPKIIKDSQDFLRHSWCQEPFGSSI